MGVVGTSLAFSPRFVHSLLMMPSLGGFIPLGDESRTATVADGSPTFSSGDKRVRCSPGVTSRAPVPPSTSPGGAAATHRLGPSGPSLTAEALCSLGVMILACISPPPALGAVWGGRSSIVVGPSVGGIPTLDGRVRTESSSPPQPVHSQSSQPSSEHESHHQRPGVWSCGLSCRVAMRVQPSPRQPHEQRRTRGVASCAMMRASECGHPRLRGSGLSHVLT